MPDGKAATTYEVVGRQAVLGRAKGDRITSAEIGDETQEQRLLDSGAIKPITPEAQPAPTTTTSPGTKPEAGATPKE